MRVFISYSHKDRLFAKKIADKLSENGVEVWIDIYDISVGANIAEKINNALKSVDYFIVILSKESTRSNSVGYELSAILMNEVTKKETIVIPLLIEDCEIPTSLKDRLYIDFRNDFTSNFQRLLHSIYLSKKDSYKDNKQKNNSVVKTYEYEISSLQNEFRNGNLALFCGAGISYDAGVPTWNMLLKSLLKEIYGNDSQISELDSKLAHIFQYRMGVSPLILAQYLKIMLDKKFIETVRDKLYENCTDKSALINSIIELIRPRRNRKNLVSIINFNFDDLIEEKLSKEKIAFKTIYSEGERYKETEFPIFHPHGFLPRNKRLTSKNEIVFSEDAYHSQFIDPFSWANLVQLNHLNHNTCLFIGISLSDPNMRRLLDVSIRKNGKDEKNHYIIKKRYTVNDLYQEDATSIERDNTIIPIIENIEERDANKLGFNLIWINEHSEIQAILNRIVEET